jgi:hypothetical protein
MASQIEDIRDWLDSVLERGADRVELRAKSDDSRIGNWKLAANDNKGTSKLATSIAREAQRDGACENATSVTYVLYAFRGEHEGLVARMRFQVDGSRAGANKKGGELEEIENPNLADVCKALLKQCKELHGLLIMNQEHRAETDQKTIERLLEQINQHEMKRSQLLEAWERVQSMQMQREREAQEMRLSEQRQKYIGDKLDMLIPIAANRLLGGGSGKGTPYMGEEMVRQIMGNISPDEVDAFMRSTNMRPELQALFTELYMAYYQKEQAKRATSEKNGSTGATKGAPLSDADRKGDTAS